MGVLKKIGRPHLLSTLAIVILAIAQLFVIRYAYQLKYGELVHLYGNVYEYAKPNFNINWSQTDRITQEMIGDRTIVKSNVISEEYISYLQSDLINEAFLRSKIEAYFTSHGLEDEIEYLLTLRNLQLDLGGKSYEPSDKERPILLDGNGEFLGKSTLVYRHIANSDYLKADIELLIYMPNRTMLLVNEMKWVLLLSILTFALISYVAIFNLRKWQKQKAIADIKDDLIDHISHEFRTPLTNISIASDSIANHGESLGMSRILEIAQLIHRQGKRLQFMVDNLLNTAFLDQEQPADMQLIDMDHFIQSYLNDMAPGFEKSGVKITTDLNAAEARVNGDITLLESMLNNLLDNAIKYCDKEPQVMVNTKLTSGMYELQISDNARGIAQEHLTHIFDKFHRASTGSKGLGLGLYQVKQVVDLHKGKIKVTSQPGKGSQFTISLPIA